MVRLKVTARIIPEDAYLRVQVASVSTLGPRPLPGEKRVLVVVPSPEEWLIGHLANEVRQTFRRTYKAYVLRIHKFRAKP
jgi:hypothetical protein